MSAEKMSRVYVRYDPFYPRFLRSLQLAKAYRIGASGTEVTNALNRANAIRLALMVQSAREQTY